MISSDLWLDRGARAIIFAFAFAGISCAAFDVGSYALAAWSAVASLFFAVAFVVTFIAGARAMRGGR